MVRNAVLSVASFIRIDGLLHEIKKRKNYSTILSLHRVSDEPDFFWPPMTVINFRKLLAYCSSRYQVSSLGELGKPSLRPRLVLSFDDGYLDFIENALPELNRFGFPSNHNVVIDCAESNDVIWTQELNHIFSLLKTKGPSSLKVDDTLVSLGKSEASWKQAHQQVFTMLLLKTKDQRLQILRQWRDKHNIDPPHARMMNWEHIRECAARDVEIGSHTVSHHTLTVMNTADLRHELTESRRVIEARLGRVCETLAVPNGQSDKNVMRTAADAGYKRLLLASDGFYHLTERDSVLPIARVNMVEESFAEMKLRLEGFHHFIRNGRL